MHCVACYLIFFAQIARTGFTNLLECSFSSVGLVCNNNNKIEMNQKEKLGIKDLLSGMDEEIVFSLAATTTKKAVVPTSMMGSHSLTDFKKYYKTLRFEVCYICRSY